MWYVYVVVCADSSYYTGITNNVTKRIETHNKGKGAKYTRSRLPVRLLRFWEVENRSIALKLEYRFKKLKRKEKETNIKSESFHPKILFNADST